MSTQLFNDSVKPLEWEEHEEPSDSDWRLSAPGVGGEYEITRYEGCLVLHFDFQERCDQKYIDSIEKGQEQAWKHHVQRLAGYFRVAGS